MPEAIAPEAPTISIESLMSGLDAATADASAPAVPQAAPAATPEAPKAEAPKVEPAKAPEAPKADTPKVEPAKAAPKEMSVEEMEKAVKANPKAWKVLESLKKAHSSEKAQLQQQIDTIKNKPVEGVMDATKVKALEDRIAQLSEEGKNWKQRAAEADYTRSEEYQTKFVAPYTNELKRAIEEMKGITLTYTDADGERKTRPATENDFRKALSLPPDEADNFIHDAFGRSAHRVISRVNELSRIREASEQAIKSHAENHEKTAAEREALTKREQAEYDNSFKSASESLKSHPVGSKYFAPKESDPEYSKSLNEGYESYDGFRESVANMTAPERAAVAATVRARYAAFQPMAAQIKSLEAKVASLTAELGGSRKVDPGAAAPAAPSGGAPASTEVTMDTLREQMEKASAMDRR